eukprot:CAMPEP_0118645774 /NCGR_PEP_ID=MMETSP0785-20121206/7685_1 /TAXON_ID=91992 /ORGANISM="Bolidomonas pacifica, Strain CCMP 1866" /LENGTH=58 /DNA_ID=CAMNT_0006537689 /DNA_START=352 /DNA_END=525 /DNA_ORIENTATION=+
MKSTGSLLYAGGASSSISHQTPDRSLPVEGVFIFNDEDKAREFVVEDPYVKEGIVGEG